jgi:hypothetical protein
VTVSLPHSRPDESAIAVTAVVCAVFTIDGYDIIIVAWPLCERCLSSIDVADGQ